MWNLCLKERADFPHIQRTPTYQQEKSTGQKDAMRHVKRCRLHG